MIDENSAELNALAEHMYKFTGDLVAEGYKPFAVAAVHAMIALQMYKTALSEEEYNLMVDSISENRDKIKPLTDMFNENSTQKFH